MQPKSKGAGVGNCRGGAPVALQHMVSFHGSAVDTAGHNGLDALLFDAPGYRLIHRGMEVQKGGTRTMPGQTFWTGR